MLTQLLRNLEQAAYGNLSGCLSRTRKALSLRSWFVAKKTTSDEDLQQLVEHFIRQLFTGSTSAPEAPAKAPGTDSEKRSRTHKACCAL